jgi:hypothetical protein
MEWSQCEAWIAVLGTGLAQLCATCNQRHIHEGHEAALVLLAWPYIRGGKSLDEELKASIRAVVGAELVEQLFREDVARVLVDVTVDDRPERPIDRA